MRRFKLITFDLDDTLWQVDPVIDRANRKMLEHLLAGFPQIADALSLEKLLSVKRELVRSDPSLMHQISNLRIRGIEALLARAGIDKKGARLAAEHAFEVFIAARNQVNFHPGVLSSLSELKADYQLAALSNGNADIHQAGLGELMSFAISAEQINASKPAPDHFLLALQYGNSEREQMLHIGDHPEHDIWAARQLGIATGWFNPSGQQWREVLSQARERFPALAEAEHFEPDFEYQHFADLKPRIQQLEKQLATPADEADAKRQPGHDSK